jgi:hypothetical protein
MLRFPLLALILATPVLHAEPLTQADKEALLEKLDALRDDARTKALGRMGSALSAFKAGMASDEAAAELYLKCLEKEFEDQKLSSQDFRERKRHESERLEKDGTKRCLRHQLRWLVLTLEAAEKPDKISELIPRASEAMASIFDSPAQFEMNVEALRQPVTETIFAKAYHLQGLKVEKWPLSPLEIGPVFEQVFLPPLRAKGSFESLREQWMRRIRYEGVAKKEWRKPLQRGEGDKDEKTIKRESSVEYEKFVAETQPEMMWQMEMDLYKAGDQKRAAVKMLEHIESNVTHPKAREWGSQFRGLIEPAKDAAETADKSAP